ncbi:hypothetical protein BGW80DRAFT_1290372 [Lactifluus volemus]|nr:hypothetical protein BGW80DRAFT_1290372 [Lactifluus volemus]
MLTPLCAPETTRSPIGYEAFVRHLIEKGHAKEIVSFVQRCDANKRVDLYVKRGEWKLRASCPNSFIAQELDQIASAMK